MLNAILPLIGKHKVESNKVVAEICPFCNGGEHHDKWTFVIHEGVNSPAERDMFYSCLRGKCGVKGNIMNLIDKLGGDVSGGNDEVIKLSKQYILPTVELDNLTQTSIDYLYLRGIEDRTIAHFKLKEHNGNIAIPFYEKGKIVLIKYRPPHKVTNGQPKSFREKGGKPVLLNMAKTKDKLIICEGEFDAMIVWQVVGDKYDVTSIPSGTKDDGWLITCWDYIRKYKRVFLWGDSDEPGREFNAKMSKRVGRELTSLIPHLDANGDESPYKDPNELFKVHGEEAVKLSIANAKDCGDGLVVSIASVEYESVLSMDRISSKFKIINSVYGGYSFGELYLITGHNGSGKTTYLFNELMWFISNGNPVGVFSGEQNSKQLKRWLYTIAGGSLNVSTYDQLSDRNVSVINNYDVEMMDAFFADKLYLFDRKKNGRSVEFVLTTIKYLYQRYGINIFFIDNLMSIKFKGDKFEAHNDFINDIKILLDEFGIMVFLVAHPRKDVDNSVAERSIPNLASISGTGDITNLADNVIAYHKFEPHGKQKGEFIKQAKAIKKPTANIENAVSILIPLKNREEGLVNMTSFLGFNEATKRIHDLYPSSGNEVLTKYNFEWEK